MDNKTYQWLAPQIHEVSSIQEIQKQYPAANLKDCLYQLDTNKPFDDLLKRAKIRCLNRDHLAANSAYDALYDYLVFEPRNLYKIQNQYYLLDLVKTDYNFLANYH